MSGTAQNGERSTDCLSCRIIGATTMLGVSAYGMVTRAQTPVAQRSHRAFLLGMSGIFAAAGIARAVWPDKHAVDSGSTQHGGRGESAAGAAATTASGSEPGRKSGATGSAGGLGGAPRDPALRPPPTR